MSDSADPAAGCGCCQGLEARTPARVDNPPGRPAIAYRVGRHGDFLASLTARLSSTDFPALAAFGSREASDFTLALGDALAASLDVLAFYVERTANEHYLRTATERLSVLEMARLIGYRPSPGVAASTYLAFTLQSLPGVTAEPVVIPVGTRVQSVPGQDEVAQTFETVAPAPARAEWSALLPQQDEVRRPSYGDTGLWLEGIATGLAPGDTILIVGTEQEAAPSGERWDVRVLTAVRPDLGRQLTEVRWAEGLGHSRPFVLPAEEGVQVFAFRKRAAVFGATAPDWRPLSDDTKAAYLGIPTPTSPNWPSEWPDFSVRAPVYPERRQGSGPLVASFAEVEFVEAVAVPRATVNALATAVTTRPPLVRSPNAIDLAAVDDKVVAGSWALLSVPQSVELYRITQAITASRAEYLLSGQTTRLTLSGELPDGKLPTEFEHAVRTLAVRVQSDLLPLARRPLFGPVYGTRVALAGHVADLVPGQPLAFSGPRPRIVLGRRARNLIFVTAAGVTRSLAAGDSLSLAGVPERLVGSSATYLEPDAFVAAIGQHAQRLRLAVLDQDGTAGQVSLRGDDFDLAPAAEDDPVVAEIAFLVATDQALTQDRERSTLTLAPPLRQIYDRRRLRINANVAPATQGETVEQIAGDGDGRQANQTFLLAQGPLTWVGAPTPSGRASTLTARISDVAWQERPTLYQAAPTERVFETAEQDGGPTRVRFGDGIEGARLPSGSGNVRLRYRKGLGVAGNVAAGKLTTLLSRPLGVSGAVNPEAASGGEDAEPLARARDNAPLTVLTLDRAVSIEDYANFARAFAGIDKAHALWVPAGPARGVFLTVAGVAGARVEEGSATFNNLHGALATYGDPLVPLRLVNFRDVRFICRLAIKVDAAFEVETVRGAVATALRGGFAVAARQFGQPVSVDEVAAVAQAVAGVVAVQVLRLHRSDAAPGLVPRLFASLPVASLTGVPAAAELLTLADGPLELEILP